MPCTLKELTQRRQKGCEHTEGGVSPHTCAIDIRRVTKGLSVTKDQDISILQPVRGLLDAYPPTVLEVLLKDNSTGTNIVWADSEYEAYGEGYQALDEITLKKITGDKVGLIVPRIAKERERQSKRTRNKAEVFTPTWVCKKMIDWADEAWAESIPADSNEPDWLVYVESPRLEITCGEAPFLVNRYDASSGEYVDPSKRTGILGRKLERVNEHAKDRGEWVNLATRAIQSVYGYEFQGDNLLVARINIMNSVADYARWAGYDAFSEEEAQGFAEIISWNLWQMDGLTNCVPYGKEKPTHEQPTLFDDLFTSEGEDVVYDGRGLAKIKDWNTGDEVEFVHIKRKGEGMKFDYIIGNPPYQEEQEGGNDSYAPPVYDKFMTGAYKLADKVELITPARFLFNAGSTPKAWNREMLSDPHLKVLFYEANSKGIFPAADIKGGIAITYRDAASDFGPIEHFIVFDELRSIVGKVGNSSVSSLKDVVYASESYRFTDTLHAEHADAESKLSKGHKYDLKTSVLSALDDITFFKDKPNDGTEYIEILGLIGGNRVSRWIKRAYIKGAENFEHYKVILPAANGSGALGEVLSTPLIGQPLIGQPLIGHTQTFISIGNFDTEEEAEACMKYVKSKFARTLLGVLKITQHNPGPKWKYVPLQDFTSSSDIDWSQSVAEIDVQLYRKYDLSKEEIEFIETHVKEML